MYSSSSVSATTFPKHFDDYLKVSQTLFSELERDRLLVKLLKLLLENSGADQAVLLMPRPSDWYVEAVATMDQPVQLKATALADLPDLPQRLINAVRQNPQPIVIADAPNWDSHQTAKSLLCMPVLHQDKPIAILYLENQVATDSFTPDRIARLSLICAQAAIALENARRYQQAGQNNVDLEAYRERLQFLIQQTPIGVIEWNADFKVIGWNPAAEELFGYSAAEMLNQHAVEILPESDRAIVAEGNLVAGVAHEINNPIGFLNGSIRNANDYVQELIEHIALYQQHYANPVTPIQENAEDIDLEFLCQDLPKLLSAMKGATDRSRKT